MKHIKMLASLAILATIVGCSHNKKDNDINDSFKQGPQGGFGGAVIEEIDGNGLGGKGSATPAKGSPEEFTVTVGDKVLFAFDKYDVTVDQQEIIDGQGAWLLSNPKYMHTEIQGHCDKRGTREYNLALGARRAEAVKAKLMAVGVPGSSLKTISYGKDKPLVEGDTEEAYAANRVAVTVPIMMASSQ